MRKFKQLTRYNRLQIEGLLKLKTPIKDIAKVLGVHISTIYREIKRGAYEHLNSDYTYETRYSSDKGELHHQEILKAKGPTLKIGKDYEFINYVEDKIINHKYSPSAVLGEIKANNISFNTSICTTTLYSYIYKNVFGKLTMKDLPMKEKRKKHNKHLIQKKMSRGTSIEKRPDEINSRTTFGHWEMDCVVGSTLPTLLVLTERLTRKEIIRLMPNHEVKSVLKELNKLERQLGSKKFREIFKSITVDNGVEFSDYEGMESSVLVIKARTKIYYCHAYCSWEKGSVERLNREIRRLIPKGSDLSKYSKEDIQNVEDWINNYPREILNFNTSNSYYNDVIQKLQL